jgi:hypothetical protein
MSRLCWCAKDPPGGKKCQGTSGSRCLRHSGQSGERATLTTRQSNEPIPPLDQSRPQVVSRLEKEQRRGARCPSDAPTERRNDILEPTRRIQIYVNPGSGRRVRLLRIVAEGCRNLGVKHPRSPHARTPRAKVSDRRIEGPAPALGDLSRFSRIFCGSDQGLCTTAITLQGMSLRRFLVL